MISRRESRKRSSGIKRICRNEKGSIVFARGVEYGTVFFMGTNCIFRRMYQRMNKNRMYPHV